MNMTRERITGTREKTYGDRRYAEYEYGSPSDRNNRNYNNEHVEMFQRMFSHRSPGSQNVGRSDRATPTWLGQ